MVATALLHRLCTSCVQTFPTSETAVTSYVMYLSNMGAPLDALMVVNAALVVRTCLPSENAHALVTKQYKLALYSDSMSYSGGGIVLVADAFD
jgi:hypothetical protein